MSEPSYPEIGRLNANFGFLATRFSWHAIRRANSVLEPLGLKTRPYALLEMAAVDGGISQREIGRIMCLDPSAVVALIDGLAAQSLVTRTQDPTDRRRSIVVATPAGSALARVAAESVERAHTEMMGALPADVRAEVTSVLLVLAMREDS